MTASARLVRLLILAAGALALAGTYARASEPVTLNVIGGLGGIAQYTQLERPFWTEEIPRISQGRIRANIQPVDAGVARQADMLRLMRLGVVPFGTTTVSLAAADEPDLGLIDLPAFHRDAAALRAFIGRNRDSLATLLRDRHRIRLLGLYVYPAQVLFCAKPFRGFSDLKGRRIRTSSVGQSELVIGLGATPVKLSFSDIVPSIRAGSADCAITGTLSGNEIGLADVTTHVHEMPISWGVSLFGASLSAWSALSPPIREVIESGVADLERRIWDRAESDTALGLACNRGAPSCAAASRKTMTLVLSSPEDDATLRGLFSNVILPRWRERCGTACTLRSEGDLPLPATSD